MRPPRATKSRAEKALKQIRKAADSPTYESAVAQIFALPLRQDACWEEE